MEHHLHARRVPSTLRKILRDHCYYSHFTEETDEAQRVLSNLFQIMVGGGRIWEGEPQTQAPSTAVDLLEGFPEHLCPLPATDGGSSPLPRHGDSLGIRLDLRSSLEGGETRARTSLPGMQMKRPLKHPPAAGGGSPTWDHSDTLPLAEGVSPRTQTLQGPRLCFCLPSSGPR